MFNQLIKNIYNNLKQHFQFYFLPKLLIFISLWLIFRGIIAISRYLKPLISFLPKIDISSQGLTNYTQTFFDLWIVAVLVALLLRYSYSVISQKSGN